MSAEPAIAPEQTPEISVVLPHFRQPEELALTLDSLARQQDAPAFEAVVADNGSPQPPEAVCAAHPFARMIVETRSGPGLARNAGAKAARAPILAFLDADCAPDPGWLHAIATRFAAPNAPDVLAGDVGIRRLDPAHPTDIECYESVFGYRQKLYVERHNFVASGNMAVHAETFAKVGPFAGIGLAEDMDWGRRAFGMGLRVEYVPEMRVETAARESFEELARKWDRQIGHDRAVMGPGLGARIKWAAKALAMPLSILADWRTVRQSDRVIGAAEREAAMRVLARVRMWRMKRMLQTLVGLDAESLTSVWRRNP